MAIVHRRVTYKLYPSPSQATAMEQVCDLHRTLYNAALQERIDAWQLSRISIGFTAQCRSLTQIRRDDPIYGGLNAQSLQVTLKRLDRAFTAFFRRAEAGWMPGFPRFKGRDRFPGFGFKTHGDGFKFEPGADWRHGRLRLSGIGTMRARGEARTPGRVVCADVQRKAGDWFLSLVVECEPHRERTGGLVAGLDWGVETSARLCHGPKLFSEFENDRPLAAAQDDLRKMQREVSKRLRGKRSKRAARARRLIARRIRRVANRRKDRNHQITTRLVRAHAVIITEDQSVENMTAKGTADKTGKNVRHKAGMERKIHDTAPGNWLSLLRTKAEEAGSRLILVDPRKHRPSETDPVDGPVRRKALSEREHALPDGRVIRRDRALAWVLWNIGQQILGAERRDGEEQAGSGRTKTVSRAA